MQKVIGLVCVVIGVLLLVWGHDIAHSIGSQVQQAFTGSPTDRAMNYYMGGIALSIVGAALVFFGKK